MTGLYDELAASAAGMIAAFGQPVTLTSVEPGGYDPETATGRPGAATLVTVMGVVTAYAAGEIDGTLVRQGDRRLALSPVDTAGRPLPEPPTGARLALADGSRFTVMAVEAASPAGAPLVYRLQLRA